jgi:hypothetical protein
MSVVRLRRSGHVCRDCGSALDLPHLSVHDCEHALYREMSDALRRVREITEKRAEMHRQRAEYYGHRLTQKPKRKRR